LHLKYLNIKAFFLFLLLLSGLLSFSQSSSEKEILKLSGDIFRWEVGNKTDSLDGLIDEKFKAVNSLGEIQTKEQYLKILRSGSVKHDSITVEQTTVSITDKTAIVTGKGRFHLTASNNKLHRHLSYIEVFARNGKSWKLIALYASSLPDQ
jgi:hypothetical protein